MKHLLTVIMVLAVLAAAVAGCDGAHRYDARLAAADSLMQTAPDSALAIIEAVCRDSLADEGDRAYRDLLLTQARYRNYITATSDSDINRALAWYRAHSGEREKLTRALIYKGAVMEELGYPDSAMLYYKQAEATADPDDYFNLGYANIRIASLYRKLYANDEICLEKYKVALGYVELTNEIDKQQICHYNIALCLSLSDTNSSMFHIKKALSLAKLMNDSTRMYRCGEFLCRLYSLHDSTLIEAKRIAHDCLTNYTKCINVDILYDLAFVYAKLGMPDSSTNLLSLIDETDPNKDAQHKLRYYWTLEILSHNAGDTVKSLFYSSLKNKISDSIDNSLEKDHIHRIENERDSVQEENKKLEIKSMKLLFFLILISLLTLIFITLFYYCRRLHTMKSIIKELKGTSLDRHEGLVQQFQAKDTIIETFVQNLVDFMQVSIDASEKDSPKVFRRRVKEAITDVTSEQFWEELQRLLDKKYGNIISDLTRNPKISEVDLRVIELMCCGFSYLEIAVTLQLAPSYISKKRRMIAKKLGLDISLQEFLSKAQS